MRKIIIILSLLTIPFLAGCINFGDAARTIVHIAEKVPVLANISNEYSDKRIAIYEELLESEGITSTQGALLLKLLTLEEELLTRTIEIL